MNWSRQFLTDMHMSVESIVPQRVLEVTKPVFEGLQVIVSLSGLSKGGVNGRTPFDIEASGVYLVLASGCHEGYDRFEPGTLQRFVRIGIAPESAQRNGFDLQRISRSAGRRLCNDDVIVIQQALTPTLRAIATQILSCPLQGALRDMYIAGKGLELTVAATESALGDTLASSNGGLPPSEVERLWRARDLATSNYQQPLGLPELAREVGMNTKKLTAGFRQLFGTSVFEYVQHYRLQEAYRMLSTGAYSVSEVASFVGYAIPHFSTLFRKHFGMPPSQLTN